MSNNILFSAGVRFDALRRVLVVCALIISFVYGSADTYVLGTECIKAAVPKQENVESSSTDFTQGEASWHLYIGLNSSVVLPAPFFFSGGRYLLFLTQNPYNNMNSLSLRSDFFKNKLIKSIKIDALCYHRNADKSEVQTITITDAAQTIASNSSPLYVIDAYPKDQQEVITLTVDKMIQESLGISFSATVGFEFAINSITIEYDSTIPPVVSREETIPVGLPLWLTADKEDAEIYYTVDGTENWQAYNPSRGIVFKTPGTYTLKYYATSGEVYSKVVSEIIKAEKPTGLDAARAANEEITVSGVIREHGNGYVLIGEDEQCNPADCVAIESANYTQLTTASVGTQITATGRPTDSFGSGVKALGSISALEINGVPSAPTAIKAASAAHAAETHYYDLSGRRVNPSTRHTRRILISTNGEKHLTR